MVPKIAVTDDRVMDIDGRRYRLDSTGVLWVKRSGGNIGGRLGWVKRRLDTAEGQRILAQFLTVSK